MPELPEVDPGRRLLEPVMRAARFEGVLLRRPDLRRPFPPDFAARLTGTIVESVERRANYLVLPGTEACPTRGCPGVVRRTVQAGRSTFACPVCQR